MQRLKKGEKELRQSTEGIDEIVDRRENPFRKLWQEFIAEKIDGDGVRRRISKWRLGRLKNYKHQSKPSPPDSQDSRSIQNWERACRNVWQENGVNKKTLRKLLALIEREKLKADPGTGEVIKGMLEEF